MDEKTAHVTVQSKPFALTGDIVGMRDALYSVKQWIERENIVTPPSEAYMAWKVLDDIICAIDA